jgi:hypothetical protein
MPLVGLLAFLMQPVPTLAGQAADAEVTFTKDIAPILQRSCQNCHRPNSMAPMSLLTYEQVRPWARSIKLRTGLRNRMGVMPPWFIEKDIGIQHFKNDPSLSDEEITKIARWVDAGAPQGNDADLPPPRVFAEADKWDIGTPVLIATTPSMSMKAGAPDWWGVMPPVPIGLTEDRYVSAMQVKESSTVQGGVGGKFIFHHALMTMLDKNGRESGVSGWPNTTLGRFGWTFEPGAGRPLAAGSQLLYHSVHLHANGEDTTAYLQVAFKFHPKGYKPTQKLGSLDFGTSDVDIRPMQANQPVHFWRTLEQNYKMTTFGPHMHAPGVRFCVEAIWGGRAEMLNCSGYDHNWIQAYHYTDDAAPLLPKGTILHGIGYFDNTPANKNVVDPRNWSGMGNRTIDNMLLLISPAIVLSDEEFRQEIATRRKRLNLAEGETVLGCPLCGFSQLPPLGERRSESQGR